MIFTLTRALDGGPGTFGVLRDERAPLCFTLEPDPPAIPHGTYQLVLTESVRAKAGELWTPDAEHRLPLVVDVPGHTGIRFHAGNSTADTRGCVLVGARIDGHRLVNSRQALTELIEHMRVLDRESIMLIVGPAGDATTPIPGGFE